MDSPITLNRRSEHWIEVAGHDDQDRPTKLLLRAIPDAEPGDADLEVQHAQSAFVWRGNLIDLISSAEAASALPTNESEANPLPRDRAHAMTSSPS